MFQHTLLLSQLSHRLLSLSSLPWYVFFVARLLLWLALSCAVPRLFCRVCTADSSNPWGLRTHPSGHHEDAKGNAVPQILQPRKEALPFHQGIVQLSVVLWRLAGTRTGGYNVYSYHTSTYIFVVYGNKSMMSMQSDFPTMGQIMFPLFCSWVWATFSQHARARAVTRIARSRHRALLHKIRLPVWYIYGVRRATRETKSEYDPEFRTWQDERTVLLYL